MPSRSEAAGPNPPDLAAGADVVTVARPTDLAGARDAVVTAGTAGTSVLIRGGGTKLGWWARPRGGSSPVEAGPSSGRASSVDNQRPSTVIDTRGLDQLIHHEPGDMTATVQAGMRLDLLQAALAPAGQWLAIDPPRRGGVVTVGGVFAANDAGPRRFGYGGVRDLVIGSTTVLADGAVSRSGGTVIKNVAGYDLNKLWCGSLGTLGLVVELTVRLHPLPEATKTVRIPAAAASASSFVTDLLASPVECVAVEWSGDALVIQLEGRAAGLDARLDQLARLAGEHGLEPELVDDDVWPALREAHGGAPGATVVRASTLPSQLGAVSDALAAAAGTDVSVTLHSHAGLGLHDAVLTGGDASTQAAVIGTLRTAVEALGGHVVVRDRPPELDDHLDPWGVPGSAIELMRSVKRAVDPEWRFAPGRFVGGI
ncbi:FAD-binding oxidoreductase [Phytoactinopolyspora limicola]|uniref:FAD-binding oxidoreductase n=1 Tax=Phytoactinopolyspora limicola TaxID=2715536 RepID=UPI00140A60A9|nr:FAD-binding oxidoreductase [Phytoactinopolyspora limicola]